MVATMFLAVDRYFSIQNQSYLPLLSISMHQGVGACARFHVPRGSVAWLT